jgi:hypothetical protein
VLELICVFFCGTQESRTNSTVTAYRKEEDAKKPRSLTGFMLDMKAGQAGTIRQKKKESGIFSPFSILGAHKMRDVAQMFLFSNLSGFLWYESVKNSYDKVVFVLCSIGTYGARPHKLVHAIVSVI